MELWSMLEICCSNELKSHRSQKNNRYTTKHPTIIAKQQGHTQQKSNWPDQEPIMKQRTLRELPTYLIKSAERAVRSRVTIFK